MRDTLCAVMGDMADLLIEQTIDDWEDDGYGPAPRRVLRCRQCGKRDLNWQQIKGVWTMFEKNGKVHICGGYEPPIEVLREIAKEVLQKTREEMQWRLFDKAKKRGGLMKLMPLLSDDQLLELYVCFIRDGLGEPDVGMGISYEREIAILKSEILKRMI